MDKQTNLNKLNDLFLTDNEYIDLYDNFSDEIVSYVNSVDFSKLFKKLPSVKEFKITLAKYAIECGLINFQEPFNFKLNGVSFLDYEFIDEVQKL